MKLITAKEAKKNFERFFEERRINEVLAHINEAIIKGSQSGRYRTTVCVTPDVLETVVQVLKEHGYETWTTSTQITISWEKA